MNDDQLALLRNIRANPDDDLSRLVYADWLEERGEQPMAELIRYHIERDRLPADSPRRIDLAVHTGILLGLHRDRWVNDLQQRFGITGVEFVRGIPEEVELPLSAFAGVSEDLFTTLPVRHVMLTGVTVLSDLRRLTMPSGVMRSATIPWAINSHIGWGGQWIHTRPRCTFTVLDPAPDQAEPALRTGRWRIICPAVWSGPDRQTETEFFEQFSLDPDVSTDSGELRLATRQFDDPVEFDRWCRVPNPFSGPHWLEWQDGRLVTHRRGLELPQLYSEDMVGDDDY
jgi:uncharacterized protein (TIGR02996 family)